MRKELFAWLCASMLAACATAAAAQPPAWRATSSPEAQRLDRAAFEKADTGMAAEEWADVQSVVVVLQGRTVYEYYRDGDRDALRNTQSVTKSALAILVGTALKRGQLASLDQPVVELMPDWKPLNPDPRAASITLGHLLGMTTGFEVSDRSGTAAPSAPAAAWARKIGAEPGQRFAYDNSGPAMVQAILERATGRRVEELASEQVVKPLDMRAPDYRNGMALMRTVDMAKLGHLLLRDGQWDAGEPMLPAGFAAQLVAPRSQGGPPVGLPYGLSWWVPSTATFFASGYAGQLVWVHRPMGLVVAVTSTISAGSAQRGQALKLARGPLFEAAGKRLAMQEK